MADFFVFPSHYEGLPGALIEAMFSKTTIIASNIPENLECVDSNMAHIFPVGNVSALTDTLIKAVKDPSNKIFSEKAFDYATQYFHINRIVRKYELAYKDLISFKP